ncbi:MAG: hypothetical protein K8R54_16275 [Bacteroidales bacterium]|nr:hypothetical protein [Bacteroidales bacterium]
MSKKEEIKKIIKEQRETSGLFSFKTTKQHDLFGMIFSPIFVLIILADWIFDFGDYTGGTPPEIFRPLALLVGIILFFIAFYGYKQKIRKEKETDDKVDELLNDLKE